MAGSILLIIVSWLMASVQLAFEVSAADSISYVGAVAEYFPVTSEINGTTIPIANAKNYVTIIKTARKNNVDIIIFPENSLTEVPPTSSDMNRTLWPSFSSIIPDPGTDTPCDNASTVVIEALRLISCAAKKYSMYVLVNLNEMENCSSTGTMSRPCPRDGYFFYNTNVVFDRTGSIISKYRKFNLYGEFGFNVTSTPEIAVFTTDFNVTFGHINCFDIYFKTPTLTLINEYNVTDILHPLRWFSELPHLTALQTQAAWSYANNVNLLSSDFNTPATGTGGSGIYIGTGGNLVTLWSESPRNALLVARIPKVINGVRSHIPLTKSPLIYEFTDSEIATRINSSTIAEQALFQENLKLYTTRIIPLRNGTTTTSLKLCDRKLCCSFYVKRTITKKSANTDINHYRYRVAVFNGVRSFYGGATAGTQICGVISCTNDTLASCGRRFALTDKVVHPTVFNNILISGNFSTGSNVTQLPNSLTTDILPLNASDFTFERTDFLGTSVRNVTYKLNAEIKNLLTFAIYGRNFSADGLPATTENVRSVAV